MSQDIPIEQRRFKITKAGTMECVHGLQNLTVNHAFVTQNGSGVPLSTLAVGENTYVRTDRGLWWVRTE